MFRQPAAGRLLARESGGRLRAVAHWQSPMKIEVGRLFHHPDKLRDRNLGQQLSRLIGEPHVPAKQTSVSLADASQRLTGNEVDNVFRFETGVGLAPAKNGNVQYGHCVLSERI